MTRISSELPNSPIGYRVTKYDPRRRSPTGAFLDDDWTGVSDIGKAFSGVRLTLERYLAAEEAYVESVRRFMRAAEVTSLTVTDLEPGLPVAGHIDDAVEEVACRLEEGQQVSGAELGAALRANLRERLWCRLLGEKGFYVHFGFDYYMYIGADSFPSPLPTLPDGVFSEPFASPYAPEPANP